MQSTNKAGPEQVGPGPGPLVCNEIIRGGGVGWDGAAAGGGGAGAPDVGYQVQQPEPHQQQARASCARADEPKPGGSGSRAWAPEEDSCIDAAVRKQLAAKDCEPSWKV